MRMSRVSMALFFAVMLSFLSLSAVAAQSATPQVTPAGPSGGYPIAVHEGTCQSPTAEPAWDVGNAITIGSDQDSPDMVGQPVGAPVLQVTKAIDVKLDDLGNQPYVLAVHASADDYDTIVACGQIAGVNQDGKLVIALAPVGGGTVNGIATLDSDTSGVLGIGKDQTNVTVYLYDSSMAMATPVS